MGSVNKTLAELTSLGLVAVNAKKRNADHPSGTGGAVTLSRQKGRSCWPPVLGPVWFRSPSTRPPLVRVHGKRIVETLLDAVTAAGIQEIVLVRGYLGEQFEVLKHRYPAIRFLEKPAFQ